MATISIYSKAENRERANGVGVQYCISGEVGAAVWFCSMVCDPFCEVNTAGAKYDLYIVTQNQKKNKR